MDSMTNVYFVRHAQPNYENHIDAQRELTAQGLADRLLVNRFFAGKPIDAVYASPYRRAYDTVLPLAQERGLDITTVEDFRERRVDSCWIDDFNSFARMQWADFDYRLTDGESLAQVQTRNVAALMDVVRRHPGQAVVVGSHGTAMCTIIHHFDPSFGYEDFRRMQGLMPWLVRFTFDGNRLAGMEAYDLFQ